ncbi:MAG: CPBP family intramembrane metalloprotease [Lachnospiraceae bacterium]|nr:CPBP family intramembrane metalloprotease [Lachnospiraceae bacterium]
MNRDKLPYLLPIRSVIFILIFVLGARITGKELSEISNWWTLVATLVNVLTIVLLVMISKKNGVTYWDLINYKKGASSARQIVIVSIFVLVAGTGCMYLAGFICYGVIPYAPPVMIAPIARIPAIVNFFLLPVSTALAEDGLYLGCGVNVIQNKWTGIITPAFFYALQHCFIPTLFDGRYILYRFLSFLPLTIILCWYYQKKRNPVPIMVGHVIIDMMTVSWVLATSMIPGFYETMLNM